MTCSAQRCAATTASLSMAAPATAIGVASPGAYRFQPSYRPQLSANVSMRLGPLVSSRSREVGLGAGGGGGGSPSSSASSSRSGTSSTDHSDIPWYVGASRPASSALRTGTRAGSASHEST
jgi:hypothetical protein